MVDLFEVALAQPEQHASIGLGVGAREVPGVRVELDSVLVVPAFAGDVAFAIEDLLRVPVLTLAREVAAALHEQDPLARRCEPVRERAAAGAGADDDHVVVVHWA